MAVVQRKPARVGFLRWFLWDVGVKRSKCILWGGPSCGLRACRITRCSEASVHILSLETQITPKRFTKLMGSSRAGMATFVIGGLRTRKSGGGITPSKAREPVNEHGEGCEQRKKGAGKVRRGHFSQLWRRSLAGCGRAGEAGAGGERGGEV